jgi:phosphoesterase RecJ-like protein
MPEEKLSEIAKLLREKDNFVLISHLRPDGDALGSTIALGLSLQLLGKNVTLWNEDGVIEGLRFLPQSRLCVKPEGRPREFDVAIALDCARFDRLGTPLDHIANEPLWVNIDHHGSNEGYGDVVLIEPESPATGEIIARLLLERELPMNAEIAENLFVAMSTDTGSFQYPSTTARTFEIAAKLIRQGLDVGEINRKTYSNYSYRRVELLRELLNGAELLLGGRVATMTLPLNVTQRLQTLPEDTEGAINLIRAIDTVVAAVFFEEMEDGKIRISMRSKNADIINVSEVAREFDGGGHPLAAGARMPGPLDEAKKNVLKAIENVLE